MSEDLEAELRYWKARAEALEASLLALRRRVLSRPGPAFLAEAPEGGAGRPWSVLDGWEDSDPVRPADVETELAGAWERLRGGSGVG